MVAVPDQLLWECVKKNHAFLKKRNGCTKRSGAVQFSTEPGNLKSIHQFKYSGLANHQVLDVVTGPDNKAQLVKKAGSKSGSQPKKTLTKIRINKDFRRSSSVVTKQTTDVFYRRDLQAAALGKYTKVYQANRRAKGVIAKVPVKKGRTSSKTD
jgi:large subunit ribosomal protein L28e